MRYFRIGGHLPYCRAYLQRWNQLQPWKAKVSPPGQEEYPVTAEPGSGGGGVLS
jgi:hypothetical protein